ncbi:MAG TPA: BamA/TamA family outer membrane protein [Candidatus Eisenbacteria bacterium]|jgi:hypothetical protein
MVLALAARPTYAQTSPDTTLGDFLRGLADSTDRYFGASAAPLDTTGLDSALVFQLTHPAIRPGADSRLEISPAPWFRFSRVDGPLWGGALSVGRTEGRGSIGGRLGYAAGPDEWLGGGEVRKSWSGWRDDVRWSLRAFAGRLTGDMDPEPHSPWLAMARALISGSDRSHYLRRDGFRATLERRTQTSALATGYRDELERPLVTTTTWTLLGGGPELTENLAATRGRVRELQAVATARIPRSACVAEGAYRWASGRLGSDFDYRRLRLALGGELPLGRSASMVPQLTWGRLEGDPVPQESFYLGGSRSIRSLIGGMTGGSRHALGRLDLISSADLLERLGIPHSPALAFQGGIFADAGAVWGRDPFGNAGRPGGNWPPRDAWLSEVGLSLLYRPGIPEPAGYLRIDYGWPLGPDGRSGRLAVAFGRILDLLGPLD